MATELLSVFTVISIVPALIALSSPFALIVATAVLELSHSNTSVLSSTPELLKYCVVKVYVSFFAKKVIGFVIFKTSGIRFTVIIISSETTPSL